MGIIEVARAAGVSTATVSRVINRSPRVREETRKHVSNVIARLNYIPNTSARALRVGRTRLFGLVISDVKNPFFPELIDGFETMALRENIDVVFMHTNYELPRLAHCLSRLIDRNVDGIAVMTSEVDAAALERVQKAGVPLVLLNQAALSTQFPTLMVDYSRGFQEAIEHLRSLGHRRIGFISGPANLETSNRRRLAFLRGMKEYKRKVDPRWIVQGDLHVEGGAAAMEALLRLCPPLTAVVAANDLMAIGAVKVIRSHGLHVPSDISVVGFDNISFSTLVDPPLTTIALPREEIATRAFSTLLNASASNPKAKMSAKTIQPRLLIRESTAQVLTRNP